MITRETVRSLHSVRELRDIAEFLDHRRRPVKEADRNPGPYPYFGANGQQGSIDGYLFDEPLILLAEDGGFFDDPDRGIAYRISGKSWVNNHAHVIRPKNGCADFAYLCRVLENYDVRPFISGTTRGKLTKGQAEKILIPIPPLEEQRRIAAILDKADALRRKRKRAVGLLAEALEAFIELTIDQAVGARVQCLGECLKFMTTGGRNWSQYYAAAGSSRFIRSLDVQMNTISDEDATFVDAPDNAEARRTRTASGDVLLTVTGSRIGRVAALPDELASSYVSQHVAILRPKPERLRPRFLSYFLSSRNGQRQIAKWQYGQTKPGLNFKQIEGFEIPRMSVTNRLALRMPSRALRTRWKSKGCKRLDLACSSPPSSTAPFPGSSDHALRIRLGPGQGGEQSPQAWRLVRGRHGRLWRSPGPVAAG